MPASAADLVALLELEELDANLFRGRQPDTELQRVFGGQVAAQALLAGARTVAPGYVAHSLHAYFLRPGDTLVGIIYDVEAIRDGRSFATRRVVARQHGHPIFFLTANFHVPEEGFTHQDAMPEVAAPEQGLSLAELFERRGEEAASEWGREWAALDARYVGNSNHAPLDADTDHPARAQLWIRLAERVSDDPLLQQAAFTYASDMSLVSATLVPHGVHVSTPGMQVASLDHAIWFHRPFRADAWWLFDQTSPVAAGGRGLAQARVFTADGTLVASVAQEGLIRYRPEG